MPQNGEGDRRNEGGDDEVGVKAQPLGDCARENGDGRAAEHDLEDEEGAPPHPKIGKIDGKIACAQPAPLRGPKHKAKPNQPKEHGGDTKIGQVFDGDVDVIFTAG